MAGSKDFEDCGMKLDAVVFCNCFEKGRLRAPPPPGCRLVIASDGGLVCDSGDFYVQAAFLHWLYEQACDHPYGRLIHLSLADWEGLTALRRVLRETPGRGAMLLSRVLRPNIREIEVIAPQELGALRAEILALGDLHWHDREIETLLRVFESRMAELVECAMFANKPIALCRDFPYM